MKLTKSPELLYKKYNENLMNDLNKINSFPKLLTLNTQNFYDFTKIYKSFSITNSFKEPNEIKYPKYKSPKYISLKKFDDIYSHKVKMSTKKSKISRNENNNINNIVTTNNFSISKDNKEKVSANSYKNFFICDDMNKNYYLTTQYQNNNKKNENFIKKYIQFKKGLKLNICSSRFKYLYTHNFLPSQWLTNENYEKLQKKCFSDKNESKYKSKILSNKKDYFSALNNIIINEKNSKIDYNEYVIESKKNEYLLNIIKQINLYTSNKKNIDNNYLISHVFETEIYGNINIYLNSGNLKIINDKDGTYYKEINLPFDIISVIYLFTPQDLKYIVSKLINNNENSNIFNKTIPKNIVKNLNKLKFNFKSKENKENKIFEKILKEIKKNISSSLYNTLREQIRNKDENLSLKKYNLIKEKNIYNHLIFNNKYNMYIYYAIINNQIHRIQLTMPSVKLKFLKYNKEINYYISNTTFLYLYNNNFEKWYSYLIYYLYSFKVFRILVRSSQLELKNYLNDLDTSKLNNELIYFTNKSSYEFIFFLDKLIYKFIGYELYVFNCNNYNTKNLVFFKFPFTLHQTKILFFKSLYDDLNNFLKRFIYTETKNNNVCFDYTFFDSFQNMSNSDIIKYFKNIPSVDNALQYQEQNKFAILLIKPHLISMSLNDDNKNGENILLKHIEKSIEINHNILSQLMNNDINKWIYIFFKYKNEFI